MRLLDQHQRPKRTVNNSFMDSFDPFGSYTGVNAFNEYEKPVQDADDL